MARRLTENDFDLLFRDARTAQGFTDDDVTEETIRELYDLLKMGPTAGNSCPARFLFIRKGSEAKRRLIPHMSGSNKEKTGDAPWTVVIAYDTEFYEKMPVLFPDRPHMFDKLPEDDTKYRNHMVLNSSLQGAYLLIAARGLGLDCGPMAGFSKDGVDAEFFEGHPERGAWKSSWLCNLGHMTPPKFDRLPRLDFQAAAAILD
ncbi:malonic semialdehyde reductase [Notoacmeibacter sp. MSK16QG-6]|uniref:malonic semialdehyde reductase n=1 Tax=Notoacmeibacter sp. MSK16QG-6 TaxID=2957982 RepID=UPI00209D8539|nr:malonic semialdehyde reductase [Notoacmeibacter sp. MSK16QG-6]MCP1198794.1 malonic semialdehyde reductase [Notoacmeibacter sp. MSK16QG-6]